MNSNLNDLPEWNDNLKDPDEEGEEWKPNPTKDACKALYKQWSVIITMLNGCLREDKEENETEETHSSYFKSIMIGDAYEAGAKIRSSEAGGIYVIRMENASIIRKNAQAIQSSML